MRKLSRLFLTLIRGRRALGPQTRSAEASEPSENLNAFEGVAAAQAMRDGEEIVLKFSDGVETHFQTCRYWTGGGCDCGSEQTRRTLAATPVVTGPHASEWKHSGDVEEVAEIIDEHSKMAAAEKALEDGWKVHQRRLHKMEMG